mgnify:CR=1 FL=1
MVDDLLTFDGVDHHEGHRHCFSRGLHRHAGTVVRAVEGGVKDKLVAFDDGVDRLDAIAGERVLEKASMFFEAYVGNVLLQSVLEIDGNRFQLAGHKLARVLTVHAHFPFCG